jgi:flavin-dependent dehydrogenase
MLRCEVAIIGGGPAGAAAAMRLSELGRGVLLLERSRYEAARVGETLPPAVRVPLAELAVWEAFATAGHLRSPGIVSFWGGSRQDQDFIGNPLGPGWHIDRQRFDRSLVESAANRGATVLQGARVVSCNRVDGAWRLEIARGARRLSVTASFLVDASGRARWLAKRQRIGCTRADRLVGIAATLRSASADRRTCIEDAPMGWWYSAALPDGNRLVALMTDSDCMSHPPSMLEAAWRRLLAEAREIGTTVDQRVFVRRCRTFAADSACLDIAAGGNWLAVGDAAAAFDPLCGQGVYRALSGGLTAAAAIDSALAGWPAAVVDYRRGVERSYAGYLRERRQFYSLERRWTNEVFWSRRLVLPPVGRSSGRKPGPKATQATGGGLAPAWSSP